MPAIVDSRRVTRTFDRRCKLTSEQRREIFENKDNLSQRKLAEMYGVSRRLITFILNPNSLEENKQRLNERGGWRIYYSSEANKESHREHRNYKKGLLEKGLIK